MKLIWNLNTQDFGHPLLFYLLTLVTTRKSIMVFFAVLLLLLLFFFFLSIAKLYVFFFSLFIVGLSLSLPSRNEEFVESLFLIKL